MKNKTALITGAGGGIGKAIAVRLAKSGVRLALCGRNTEKLEDTRQAVLPYTEEPLLLPGDLTDDGYLFSLAEKTAAHFGSLDILINNAGMAYNGPFAETSTETFDSLMKINARCPYFLSQSAIPYLKESDYATIINISSNMGHTAYKDQSAYIASKHALHGLTKALAKEVYADGIRCHLISPGGVYTDMVRIARPDLSPEGMIMPEEVADAVAFLIEHRGNAIIDEMRLHRLGKEPF